MIRHRFPLLDVKMRSILISITILLFVGVSFSQSSKIEDGWRGLRVFVTNKESVDQILGKPLPTQSTFWTTYSTPEARVEINFSSKPCSFAQGEMGAFDVPENTILEFGVLPKQPFPLKDLKWSREKYEILPDREPDTKIYHDSKSGIWVNTKEVDGTEIVSQIFFRAPASLKEIRKCNRKLQ